MNVREGQGTLQMKDKNTYKVIYSYIKHFRVPSKTIGQTVNAPSSTQMVHTTKERSLKASVMVKASSLRSPQDLKTLRNL